MCGILGFIKNDNFKFSRTEFGCLISSLYKLSQSRGQDASGWAQVDKNKIEVFKTAKSPDRLVSSFEFKELVSRYAEIEAFIGHARMETNGTNLKMSNNQPVVKDNCISIHNGIILNDRELWEKHKNLKRLFEVDTEVINSLLNNYINNNDNLEMACENAINELEGSFSIATLFENLNCLFLATNTGSLYTCKQIHNEFIFFASEKVFIQSIIKNLYHGDFEQFEIKKLEPGKACIIELGNLERHDFFLNSEMNDKIGLISIENIKRKRKLVIKEDSTNNSQGINIISNTQNISNIKKFIIDSYKANTEKIHELKRCVNCILPETMPFINFDEKGICNYCKYYKHKSLYSPDALEEILTKYRSKTGKIDCIVAFSGGRDSSFSLDYIKEKLRMNPIAYSYDWGMLTDIGRRNQARMLGNLGIEHILIAADIHRKRLNIHKNVEAWLRKPSLGTIPLFMAGDKQYFYYANTLKKKYGLDLLIMGENYLEKTVFKNGFAGIKQDPDGYMAYHVSNYNKMRMLFYYLGQVLSNVGYINDSIIDTVGGFLSYYFIDHTYLNLFDYIKWDEGEVDRILKQHSWEYEDGYSSSWRIGDGTVAFYNYIYYSVAGFTENDTFRSNQIREGQISRETAIRLTEESNYPRLDSLIWYANTINIDIFAGIHKIEEVKKLYV